MRKIFHVHAALLLLSLLFMSSVLLAQNKKKVLILHSYHSKLPWTQSMMMAMEKVLDNSAYKIDYHVEYMDTKRYYSGINGKYIKNLEKLYFDKYHSIKFDVIIASDDNALNFTIKNHKKIFNDMPVVFCGVNSLQEGALKGDKNITGVMESHDTKETLNLILRLFPKVKKIAMVTDLTVSGRKNREEIEGLEESFRSRAEFLYLDEKKQGLSYSELLMKIKTLPRNCAIYFADFFYDTSGFVEPSFIIREISKLSSLPISANNGNYLGFGIFGGKLNHSLVQGEAAAKRAVDILSGKKVSDIPIYRKSLNRYMFDHQKLENLGISDVDLPENSIIINKPFSLIEEYQGYIAFVILVLALLAISNIVQRLQINRKNKKIYESEKQFRTLAENSPGIVFLQKKEDVFKPVYLNDRIKDITGYSKKLFYDGKVIFSQLIHEDDYAQVKKIVKNAIHENKAYVVNYRIKAKDGSYRWIEERGVGFLGNGLSGCIAIPGIEANNGNSLISIEGVAHDISDRKELEIRQEELINELKEALETVKVLKGFIPICGHCKKIRDDSGFWNKIEEYISSHSEAQFTHSICPDCVEKYYSEFDEESEVSNE